MSSWRLIFTTDEVGDEVVSSMTLWKSKLEDVSGVINAKKS